MIRTIRMESTLISTVAESPWIATGLLLLTATLLLYAAKRFFQWTLPFQFDEELSSRNNPAFGVLLGGILIGCGFATAGAFFGHWEDPPVRASIKLLLEGLLAIGLLRLSIAINDRSILAGFSIHKEIGEDQNLGVALTVVGSVIASACVINGALTGYSPTFWHGLRDIVLFWIVGQATLVLGAVCFRRLRDYDVHRVLEYDQNPAVGLVFGSFLLGIGIITRAAVVGSGNLPLGQEITRSLLLSAVGIALLAMLDRVLAKTLLPGISRTEAVEMNRSNAIGAPLAGITLGVALIIAELLKRS